MQDNELNVVNAKEHYLKDVEISEAEQCANELNRHYIPSRYPDVYPSGKPEDYYTEKIAEEALILRKENKRIRKEPDALKKAIQEYCKEVIKRFKPACIILYGSRTKETFTGASDIDIIVISSDFEQDFLSRIKDLIDANTSHFPIEPLGYTEAEFETMLMSFRITALDAVREGVPLYGENYFNNLKNKLTELEKTGLYKGKDSWHIPAAATG